MAKQIFIYDHTPFLEKSKRRRIFLGQSISLSTFLISLLTLLVSLPFAFLLFRITSFLPQFLTALAVAIPLVIPLGTVFFLLESKNEGDSFLVFLKKKWKFIKASNQKDDEGNKSMYCIGLAPKERIIKGRTIFIASSVSVPKNISNLSGFINGEPVDETKTVKSGIIS